MENYPGGWFGKSWGAPVCEPDRHKPTPVDTACTRCTLEIRDDDDGMAIPSSQGLLYYHRLCMLISVVPCGMWDDEIKAWAYAIGYEHAACCPEK